MNGVNTLWCITVPFKNLTCPCFFLLIYYQEMQFSTTIDLDQQTTNHIFIQNMYSSIYQHNNTQNKIPFIITSHLWSTSLFVLLELGISNCSPVASDRRRSASNGGNSPNSFFYPFLCFRWVKQLKAQYVIKDEDRRLHLLFT